MAHSGLSALAHVEDPPHSAALAPLLAAAVEASKSGLAPQDAGEGHLDCLAVREDDDARSLLRLVQRSKLVEQPCILGGTHVRRHLGDVGAAILMHQSAPLVREVGLELIQADAALALSRLHPRREAVHTHGTLVGGSLLHAVVEPLDPDRGRWQGEGYLATDALALRVTDHPLAQRLGRRLVRRAARLPRGAEETRELPSKSEERSLRAELADVHREGCPAHHPRELGLDVRNVRQRERLVCAAVAAASVLMQQMALVHYEPVEAHRLELGAVEVTGAEIGGRRDEHVHFSHVGVGVGDALGHVARGHRLRPRRRAQ